ncbi:hypothetical protein AVEN_222304-1 [Araneus ventricosus]|uniref:Uncharacterized protein n=1 Tax=Araneus ventricosus TaxID=182803 RepID=A0A4Y2KH05_ARAVE|nr:hypothetical protein AVEN_222304-1 [Araneus ventricosus]
MTSKGGTVTLGQWLNVREPACCAGKLNQVRSVSSTEMSPRTGSVKTNIFMIPDGMLPSLDSSKLDAHQRSCGDLWDTQKSEVTFYRENLATRTFGGDRKMMKTKRDLESSRSTES